MLKTCNGVRQHWDDCRDIGLLVPGRQRNERLAAPGMQRPNYEVGLAPKS